MGHRLSKITTRTGDAGETGLGDGSRVAKDSARVAALGDIDELNSAIGVVLAEELPKEVRAALDQVQHDLFDLGGELSIPGHAMLGDAQVAALESWLEEWNAPLAPLKEFILPGGGASCAHGVPARRENPGRARPSRAGRRRGAALPQPPVRSSLRRRPRAQSRRRPRRRAVAPQAQGLNHA